jgi:hypothetical protein
VRGSMSDSKLPSDSGEDGWNVFDQDNLGLVVFTSFSCPDSEDSSEEVEVEPSELSSGPLTSPEEPSEDPRFPRHLMMVHFLRFSGLVAVTIDVSQNHPGDV